MGIGIGANRGCREMGDGHVDSRWKWKMERGKLSNELKS